jgi:hypothetical protein
MTPHSTPEPPDRPSDRTAESSDQSSGQVPPAAASTEDVRGLLGRRVVLDTAGPLTYLGTLVGVRPDGFWLEGADIRDRNEGHVTKERYIFEAREEGIRANRRRIFVFTHVVVSMSALDDVITDYPTEAG